MVTERWDRPALPLDAGHAPEPGPAALAAAVFAAVAAACLLGVATRPMGQLAAIWPANALLLGLLVRFPRLRRAGFWLAATGGYLAAGAVSGDPLPTSLLQTAGNLVGVGAGLALQVRLPVEVQRLRHPMAVPLLVLTVALASAASGGVGMVADPLLFGGTPWSGWRYWFVTEAANHATFLPVLLALPSLRRWWGVDRRRQPPSAAPTLHGLAPVVALAASFALALAVAGAGTIAYPVPALLWCALTYGVFQTAMLTLGFCAWAMLSISSAHPLVALSGAGAAQDVMSIRLGVTLVALAPLTVACVMATRNDLLRRLAHAASHDELSGLLNRRAFHERAQQCLQALASRGRTASLLMLDIDRFKQINDTWGHAAGDRVLAAFAESAARCLREGDHFGRVGGEEFAILLPDCPADCARRIAERVRESFAQLRLALDDGGTIATTVSIGVATSDGTGPSLGPLMAAADRALYVAKAEGRNRVQLA